jgi:hypothetical protein
MSTLLSPHLFLSYSRRQFYFAESVVLALQKADVPIWFDVQQLAPGEQWRDEIQRGLEEASGLIVIASGSAMASKYVRAEWEPLIDAGKPVYIALFEACDIPDKLRDNAAGVIDMRGNFRQNLKRLVALVNGQSIPPDKLPKRNRFRLPTRLPFTIATIVNTLLIGALLYFFTAIINVKAFELEDAGVFLIYLGAAWYLFNTALELMRRTFSYRQVWIGLLLVLPVGILFPVTAPVILLFTVMFVVSPATYRWLPTGAAPNWMRRRYGAGHVPTLDEVRQALAADRPPRQQRYTIYYAIEDDPLASTIQEVLTEDGHLRVGHDDPADQHIVVLTNRTPVAMLAEMVAQHPDTLTPVIAANVNPREAVAEVGDFQFIDYRRHDRRQLEAVSLFYQYPDDGKVVYGMAVLPQSSNTMIFPNGVMRFNFIARITFMAYVFLFGFGILSVILELTDNDPTTTAAVGIYMAVLSLMSAALHLHLIRDVQNRTIHRRQFRRRLIILAFVSFAALTFGVPQLLILLLAWGTVLHWLPHTDDVMSDDAPMVPLANPNAAYEGGLRDVLFVAAFFVVLYLGDILQVVSRP